MVEQFIRDYGLLAVFIGVAVEGEATMITAGVLARLQLLNFTGIWVVGTVASWAGDTLWYFIGRFAGGFYHRKMETSAASGKIERLAGKYGAWSILLSRFVWGTRMAMMGFWGFHRFPFLKFAVVLSVGCILWATLMTGLGYFFTLSAELIIGKVRGVNIFLLILLLIVIIVAVFLRFFLRKKRQAALPKK